MKGQDREAESGSSFHKVKSRWVEEHCDIHDTYPISDAPVRPVPVIVPIILELPSNVLGTDVVIVGRSLIGSMVTL